MIGQILKAEIDEFTHRLRCENALLQRARQGKVTPSVVLSYLASILHLIRQTHVHLEQARKRAEERGDAALAAHFAQKLREERGHDVWAENDIEVITSRFGGITTLQPAASVIALIDYLAATIESDPRCYLVYTIFAEYLTVVMGPEWVMVLQDRCGLPENSMTVISNHVELDKRHAAEGLREIDLLVDRTQLHSLQETLRRSMSYFEGFVNEIDAQAA